jgi:hypothetical protein
VPATTMDVTKYVIGAAEVYYRARNVSTAWTSVGRTMDDVVARILQSRFNAGTELNGQQEPVQGLDYQTGGGAEFEFTLPELSATNLALAIPGSSSTTRATTVDGAGLSTTTTAATLVGATTVPLTATTNLVVGDYIKIDTASNIEYRQVTGISGLNASFRDPLKVAHASGVAVVETLGDGATVVSPPSIRRLPDSAYRDWALVFESPGAYGEIRVYDGIATSEEVELSTTDDGLAGFRVTIGARRDPTDLTLPSWEIIAPAT